MVPEATSEWKPEIAPHAMVMKRNGKIEGEPSGTSLTSGAAMVFQPTAMPATITPRAMKSWWELM